MQLEPSPFLPMHFLLHKCIDLQEITWVLVSLVIWPRVSLIFHVLPQRVQLLHVKPKLWAVGISMKGTYNEVMLARCKEHFGGFWRTSLAINCKR